MYHLFMDFLQWKKHCRTITQLDSTIPFNPVISEYQFAELVRTCRHMYDVNYYLFPLQTSDTQLKRLFWAWDVAISTFSHLVSYLACDVILIFSIGKLEYSRNDNESIRRKARFQEIWYRLSCSFEMYFRTVILSLRR